MTLNDRPRRSRHPRLVVIDAETHARMTAPSDFLALQISGRIGASLTRGRVEVPHAIFREYAVVFEAHRRMDWRDRVIAQLRGPAFVTVGVLTERAWREGRLR